MSTVTYEQLVKPAAAMAAPCAECERVYRGIKQLFDDGYLYCQCNCECDGDGHSKDCDVCGPCLVAAVVQNRSPFHPSARGGTKGRHQHTKKER